MSRTLEATIDISASPQQVWAVLADLPRMKEFSPQCRGMKVLGGPVGVGTSTININRRGALVWPTTSKILTFEPGRELRFRVNENRTIWSFVLEPTETGTHVVQRREAPTGTTKISRTLINLAMGGTESFDDEMIVGMNATLTRLKHVVEATPVTV
ncbi:SRPBCC family protein [Rhodococcus sp. HM1]|uniref:SRPBCC family protein n=1 Tax=unclassified Rhodococcus (in: high G+C Gram-positive bacteria) TaxID=192944 RepID=UPI0018CDAEA6|nr:MULTISPECIES: SRPBCC family protein [unclassified Rhodococcus (in: high G+C Gram-positive bacteria)]MBH0120656.1 SRPBCC family protein [Rhodococcus sp. CX]MCK8675513.1 SRPBCC family protein [Rhodococcus sp. HM1]